LSNNPTQFQPGNQLGVVHGMRSEALIVDGLPAEVERLALLILETTPYTNASHMPLIVHAARLQRQVALYEGFLERIGKGATKGSMWDSKGKARPGVATFLTINKLLLDDYKQLGIGPLPQALVQQAMAGASKDHAGWQEAQQRLRDKHLSSVVA
jgi:hypothetical protein